MKKNKSKHIVFWTCLLPFGFMIYMGFTNNLGANPIEETTHFTGQWALYFLLITLSITPLKHISGKTILIRYRRMLGLYAFFYSCLHFISYIVLDKFFDFIEITQDIISRPYISIGFFAFILLIPLAITSNKKMMKLLGRKWSSLHKVVYIISTLGILHFFWLVKADTFRPIILASILFLLLILRLPNLKSLKFK